ncbi:MAG: universal stress protein [Acidobacteria bacterium]|nr:universal stress protein [Acidobacteriota bacterium]
MLSLAKILVPVDFSDRSLAAARNAISLARHFHSEILLLHVVPPLHYEISAIEGGAQFVSSRELSADIADRAWGDLNSFLSSEFDCIPAQRILLEGNPALKIVSMAHAENASLIVMSTRGYGPFRRFLLGSVTAKVLHDAECPVWTGAHLSEAPAMDAVPLRRVACAVDLGPHSRVTLCWGARMAAEFGAELILVHANTLPEVTGHGGQFFAPEWRAAVLERATEEIAQLQQSLGTQAEIYVESGDVAKVVRQAAERFGADLLVVGRSAASGLAGRLRTNAYAIIRESPCPVVSV